MGVIFLETNDNIKVIAVGGKVKAFIYFCKVFRELRMLARLLNAKPHICFMDREAWELFCQDENVLASTCN